MSVFIAIFALFFSWHMILYRFNAILAPQNGTLSHRVFLICRSSKVLIVFVGLMALVFKTLGVGFILFSVLLKCTMLNGAILNGAILIGTIN